METIFYRIEADIHPSELSVDYSDYEYDLAVKHFKRWLNDKEVFNEMFYKITTKDGKILNKEYIKIMEMLI